MTESNPLDVMQQLRDGNSPFRVLILDYARQSVYLFRLYGNQVDESIVRGALHCLEWSQVKLVGSDGFQKLVGKDWFQKNVMIFSQAVSSIVSEPMRLVIAHEASPAAIGAS